MSEEEEEQLVRSLREVVGERCTDEDIRSVLVECGMELDDAVQRLLSLDTFRKVKSKRERRKETVGNNNGGVASDTSSKDRDTAAQDIENQLTAPPEHVVKITGGELSPQSISLNAFSASDNFFMGKIVSGTASQVRCPKVAFITSSTAPETGLSQVARTGGDLCDLFTAEAFREGEQQIRRPDPLMERSETFQDGDQQKLSHFHPKLLHVSSSCVQPMHFSEQQTAFVASISSTPMTSTTQDHGVEEFQVSERDTERNTFCSRSNILTSSCLKAPQDETSAAANLQQLLSLRKSEQAAPRSNDDSSVVFPQSLQNLAADCSHINFGRLKLDKHSSGSMTFNSLKDNNQEATSDGLSSFRLDTRSSEYMDEYRHDYQLGSFSSEHQLRTGIRNISAPSQVQLNISKLAAQHECKGQFPVPDFHFKRFPDFSSPSVPVSLDARNLSPLYEELEARTRPIPAHPLTSSMKPVRHAEICFPFPGHSASKDTRGFSSAAAPANSISEVLYPGDFSLAHPYLEIPGTANSASRHVLPRELFMKPPFTPVFPVEDSVNWNRSSVMPQSDARGLSAFLQSYPRSGIFHDSQAFMNYGSREARHRGSTFTDGDASSYELFSDSIALPRSIPSDSQYPRENNLGRPLIGGPGSIASSRSTLSGSDGVQYRLYQEPRQQIPRYEQSQQQYQDYSSLGYTNFALSQMRFSERQPHWTYNTPSSNSLASSKQQQKYSQLKF